MKHFSQNQNAFTLIEILLTVVVIGIITAIGAQIITNIIYSLNLITIRKDMLFSSRVSMNRIVREIRHVDLSTITKADSDCFQAEIFIDTNKENVSFRLDGTDLKRNGDILANNLKSSTGLNFSYWDENNNEMSQSDIQSNPNNINRVDIKLSFQKGDQVFYYESGVWIRNK